MKSKKVRRLECDLFPVILVLIDTEEAYEEILSKVEEHNGYPVPPYPRPNSAHTVATETQKFGVVIFVTIAEQDDYRGIENILTHEAVHVWQYTMKTCGERKAGKEIEAYGITYFARYLISEFYYRHPDLLPIDPKEVRQTKNEHN